MNGQMSYVRSIRGPVMLITLGVLMLVDHFGPYSFWRIWPAFLVVLGLMILLERAFSGRAQPDSPPEQAGPAQGGN